MSKKKELNQEQLDRVNGGEVPQYVINAAKVLGEDAITAWANDGATGVYNLALNKLGPTHWLTLQLSQHI